MTQEIDKLIEQVGTDTSGKWMRIDQVHEPATLVARDVLNEVNKFSTVDFALPIVKEKFGIE
jgi:hypothetical protein